MNIHDLLCSCEEWSKVIKSEPGAVPLLKYFRTKSGKTSGRILSANPLTSYVSSRSQKKEKNISMVRLGDPESRWNFKPKSNSKGPDLEAFQMRQLLRSV